MRAGGAEGVLLAAGEGEATTDEPARTVLVRQSHPFLDATWSRYAPGERGPGPHFHERHVDAFYVLSGELVFGLGGGGEPRPVRAPAGTLVAVPPHVVHTFGNESRETATFLNLHAPGCGFVAHLRDPEAPFDSVDASGERGRDPGDVVVVAPGGGEVHRRPERVNAILLDLPELSVFLFEAAPPFAVAPHTHDDQVDSFLVLDGEAVFHADGRDVALGEGGWSSAPPGVVHGFRVAGAARTQLLNVHAPDAGFAERVRRRPR